MKDIFGYPIEQGALVTAPIGNNHAVAGEVTDTDMLLNRITVKSYSLAGNPEFIVKAQGVVIVDGFRGEW